MNERTNECKRDIEAERKITETKVKYLRKRGRRREREQMETEKKQGERKRMRHRDTQIDESQEMVCERIYREN